MVMTRTTILTLTNSLAHSQGDSDTMTDTFDAFLDELARTSAPFIDKAAFTPTDGTAEYSYPSTAIVLLAVFHGTKQLPLASMKELEAYSATWRATAEGTPIVHAFTERDARKVLLWPTPDTTASNGGTFIYAENRTTDIPVYLALPIVFAILAEEFAYPSDHQDMEMAEMCAQMAQLLRAFVEI